MKNYNTIELAAYERSNKTGVDVEKILDAAKGMMFAQVDNARVYAFAKTGIWSSKKATQEWHDAIRYFNSEVRGH